MSSNGILGKSKFESLFEEVDKVILPLLNEIDIGEISKHNAGYQIYSTDKYKFFIENEKKRFLKTIDLITSDKECGTICDLGCFMPYLPIALSLLGFEAKIVDKYDYYGKNFKYSILKLAEKNKIEAYDLDILCDRFEVLGKNDVVLLMAVVEHLNGSPRLLFDKIKNILHNGGYLIFEVPNIAEFTKRIRLLLGKSPFPDYSNYFYSAYPFTGHNREMTVPEVVYLFNVAGFEIEYLNCYDYASNLTVMARLARLIKKIIPSNNMGESILAKGIIAS